MKKQIMTKNQRIHLIVELWANACAAQGWDPKDDSLRHAIYERLHSLPEDAPYHIDHTRFRDFTQSDFDRVKAELLRLAKPDNITAQLHQLRQPVIRAEHVIRSFPQLYVMGLCKDRFGTRDWQHLSDSDKQLLALTLHNRDVQPNRDRETVRPEDNETPELPVHTSHLSHSSHSYEPTLSPITEDAPF